MTAPRVRKRAQRYAQLDLLTKDNIVSTTITLEIEGKAVQVPIRTTVSKSLLKRVDEPIGTLRGVGMNTKMAEAVVKNPACLPLVRQLTGKGVSAWHEERTKAVRESYGPEAPQEVIDKIVQEQFSLHLMESFPDLFDAVQNPRTAISITDPTQTDAAVAVVIELMDTTQLTAEQKAAILADGFWDEQDLSEVARVVDTFREVIKR